MAWIDPLLRIPLSVAHKLLQAGWFIRRPRTYGAHAIALTPERKIILVKLRYAPGWRAPGGGRGRGETAEAAGMRELREEIGMTSHGRIRLACELEERVAFKRDLAALLIVEDVCYRPRRWSWEVQEVREFALERLPPDTAEPALRWIGILREKI